MGAPVHHRHPYQRLPVMFHSHVRRNKAQEVNMKVESEWRKKVFARNYSASSKVKYTAANSLFHFWYHWSEVKSFKRWRSCRYPPWDFKAGCGREEIAKINWEKKEERKKKCTHEGGGKKLYRSKERAVSTAKAVLVLAQTSFRWFTWVYFHAYLVMVGGVHTEKEKASCFLLRIT